MSGDCVNVHVCQIHQILRAFEECWKNLMSQFHSCDQYVDFKYWCSNVGAMISDESRQTTEFVWC